MGGVIWWEVSKYCVSEFIFFVHLNCGLITRGCGSEFHKLCLHFHFFCTLWLCVLFHMFRLPELSGYHSWNILEISVLSCFLHSPYSLSFWIGLTHRPSVLSNQFLTAFPSFLRSMAVCSYGHITLSHSQKAAWCQISDYAKVEPEAIL